MDEVTKINTLRDGLLYIIKEGEKDCKGIWNSQVPLMHVVAKTIPRVIVEQLSFRHNKNVHVLGRSGSSGRWSITMYMCIFDEYNCINGKYQISTGSNPAFLTSPDCRKIYLVYMLGIGEKMKGI